MRGEREIDAACNPRDAKAADVIAKHRDHLLPQSSAQSSIRYIRHNMNSDDEHASIAFNGTMHDRAQECHECHTPHGIGVKLLGAPVDINVLAGVFVPGVLFQP